MANNKTNITLFLLIISLFTGATIEISEGSIYTGFGLFFIAVILATRLHFNNYTTHKYSKLYLLLGLIFIAVDLIYNLSAKRSIGTLDTMTFFLGISLMAVGIGNKQSRHLGEFGTYICFVFIILYSIFYVAFGKLNIDFIHTFDHYLILLPTVKILELTGIPIEVTTTETVHLQGVEDLTIIIGGPCSGLYSMFLLIGIVFGYSKIEKIEPGKTLLILGLSILIAYISNLFRVIILYLTAYEFGQKTMTVVHTHLGWIIFAVVAAFIIYCIKINETTI
jgi:archaeosortase C (PEF-CTERM variant)